MSERGLVLALQRIHDDPGFTDRVDEDPDGTLGIYDLDETERTSLVSAVKNDDHATIRQMASQVGIDWTAAHIGGVGAINQQDAEAERGDGSLRGGPGAIPGDGYEGVMPTRPPGA